MRWVEIITESHPLTNLRKHLMGLRGGKGIAILTAQNPATAEPELPNSPTNQRRMGALFKVLRQQGLAYAIQDGMFEGSPEKSVIVYDISRRTALAIGAYFEQNAVIYAAPGRPGEMSVEMLGTTGDVGKLQAVAQSLAELPQNQMDNFSVVKGRKYVFPFSF